MLFNTSLLIDSVRPEALGSLHEFRINAWFYEILKLNLKVHLYVYRDASYYIIPFSPEMLDRQEMRWPTFVVHVIRLAYDFYQLFAYSQQTVTKQPKLTIKIHIHQLNCRQRNHRIAHATHLPRGFGTIKSIDSAVFILIRVNYRVFTRCDRLADGAELCPRGPNDWHLGRSLTLTATDTGSIAGWPAERFLRANTVPAARK